MTKPKKVVSMTASEVVTALRRHYGAERDGLGPEWAALAEFSLHPGGGRNRIDLMMVRAWGGRPKGHERHAIEVKVARTDLLNELRNLEKSAPFRARRYGPEPDLDALDRAVAAALGLPEPGNIWF